MASVRSISLLLLPITLLLLVQHTCCKEYFFSKDRVCQVQVERVQPKVLNPGGPCSTMHEVRCGEQITLESIRVGASEKLGFEVVDVLDWDTRGPLDDTITIMEDTKIWVTDAPVRRPTYSAEDFDFMHDDL
ncbi:Hypp432 [Branchiostoma lanceolatum]|uniref:Hypp432 protein n=1 Tax=Branchiostoma lanceolatum TaxID=7740 RepID=A0A8J9YQQ3_BRALA|nr:Hypp432 [Branchiostoma lanceolatum]